MKISKQERKRLIKIISQASGTAQYAIEKKMSDEQLVKASQNLESLALLKPANNYNRYCQGQKTKAANAKLKQFMSLHNSETLQAGKWLMDALSKSGKERQDKLLEKGLVHKTDYNNAVADLRDVIKAQQLGIQEQTDLAVETIGTLEKKLDIFRKQLGKIQNYVTNNYSAQEWRKIKEYLGKSRRNLG